MGPGCLRYQRTCCLERTRLARRRGESFRGSCFQHKLAELVHWELLARPDLGHVEGIEAKLVSIGFLRIHDLDVSLPCNLFSTLDGIPELSLRIVWILAARLDSFRFGHLFLPWVAKK